ncbi:MAG: hypothetical protein MUF71_18925 [Candidatus Kapabacteria bacterium]|jgi:hypothetical protein|nr:hypothetical protein [Candidatus Kapabacteria bacterium]
MSNDRKFELAVLSVSACLTAVFAFWQNTISDKQNEISTELIQIQKHQDSVETRKADIELQREAWKIVMDVKQMTKDDFEEGMNIIKILDDATVTNLALKIFSANFSKTDQESEVARESLREFFTPLRDSTNARNSTVTIFYLDNPRSRALSSDITNTLLRNNYLVAGQIKKGQPAFSRSQELGTSEIRFADEDKQIATNIKTLIFDKRGLKINQFQPNSQIDPGNIEIWIDMPDRLRKTRTAPPKTKKSNKK